MQTTVIYHSADFDGIFCREIARKFLGEKDVEYIGWNFGDPPIPVPTEGTVYVMDLPVDKPFGSDWSKLAANEAVDAGLLSRLVWIDHHASSIASIPNDIPGYRIDGVAACRLAWQWFANNDKYDEAEKTGVYPVRDRRLPSKQDFIDRKVMEPLAVRLAGEYDVWQHEPSKGADIAFQFGLNSRPELDWKMLLSQDNYAENQTWNIVGDGQIAMRCCNRLAANDLSEAGFLVEFEGLKFLALNTVGRGSGKFESRDRPETGHDALMAFGFRGKLWTVSLYHAAHRTDLDLSAIAVKHGGGGHKGACGFTCNVLPFSLS